MKREEKKYKKERKESSEKERNYAIEKLKKITILQNSNEQNKDFWLHGFPFFCLVRCFVISFFIHFFKPQVAIDSFIKFVCYLFVCVRFWLFTSSTSMNIYIENILFPWYYTLKPSIAFPFKFLLDFSLFLLSFVIFGLKQN